MRNRDRRFDLTRDVFLPILLLTAVGGMVWAVRGCSGFGAVKGCVFAGVTWGAAWWYMAHDPSGEQSRRYASGWIILALTVGIGLSGAQGWMQWPSFWRGELQMDPAKHVFAPISPNYGYLWLFIAGMPWAGIGACMLAWTGSKRPTPAWLWSLRLAFGFGMAYLLGTVLFNHYPRVFLPLYDSLKSQYDVQIQAIRTVGSHAARKLPNPNLGRLYGDNHAAITHLGFYLGFLLFEILRRDWKNVVLILTVGVVAGTGWAAFRNWSWAEQVWPTAHFNFWRCWESSGGLSIGFAYGIAYALANRRMSDQEIADRRAAFAAPRSVLPDWAAYPVLIASSAFVAWCLTQLLSEIPAKLVHLFGMAYIIIAVVCGIGAWMVNLASTAEARKRYFAQRLPDLDWLTVYLSLFTLVSVAFIGELHGTSYFYGIALVAGFGIVYTLVCIVTHSIRDSKTEAPLPDIEPVILDPHRERFGLYLGLILGLGMSIKNGLKGWANIYLGNEGYWEGIYWRYTGYVMVGCLALLILWFLWRVIRLRVKVFRGDVFPHAFGIIWLVMIIQNIIAQLVTGPGGLGLHISDLVKPYIDPRYIAIKTPLASNWVEMTFAIYYVLLLCISAATLAYYQLDKRQGCEVVPESP